MDTRTDGTNRTIFLQHPRVNYTIYSTLSENMLYIEYLKYCRIIDFNEVDMRIYLPEKSDIHRGCKAEVNITFKGR